jgi:hypothetical protein
MYRSIVSFIAFVVLAIGLKAQISEGGTPYSWSIVGLKSTTSLPRVNLKNLDIDKLLEEDILNPSPFRYGVCTDSAIDIKANGETIIVPGKGKVWRLRIGSENSKSIQIAFKMFVLPQGAQLFLYNDNQTRQAGAFTKNNMQKDSAFVLADFKGNHVIIDYYEPDNPEYSGKLVIGSISLAYKEFLTSQAETDYINVNCAIGKDAQLEKHAVAKMTFRSGPYRYLCSGALINNVRQDGTPYFITANHCLSDSASASTLVTYFNYEVLGCIGDTLSPLTLTGASLLSTAKPSDYTLLLLNNMPTSAFQPYYAGWDVNDSATKMVTGIHHPEGNPKKLSIDYDSIYANPVKISWEGSTDSPVSSHWVVGFDEGITAGGSSGSPLFNSKNQIIGQLHGGDDVMDLYGKLSYSYVHKPARYAALGDFLDPDNTGTKVLDGYSPADNPPDAFFVTANDMVCFNSPVLFTDYSVFGPFTRIWSITPSGFAFLDGTSETSPNPVIEFFDDASYTVKLDLSVAGIVESTESKTIKAGKTIDIIVKSKPDYEICDCDFNKIRLSALGAQNYSWSIPIEDENKISIDRTIGDTVIVTRLASYHADSSYTIALSVIGSLASCIDTAQITHTILKPPNDEISNAILLTYGRSADYTNICATVEAGEPIPPFTSCTSQSSWCDEFGTGDSIVGNSVWFKFQPSVTGTISLSSSGFDNQIALYAAESYSDILNDNYTLLAANDDRSSSDFRPLIKSERVVSGKTYWIQVDGSGGNLVDNFYLNIINLMSTNTENQLSGAFIVFPQPAIDHVVLKGGEFNVSSVSLSVYSISGKCIFNEEVAVNQDEITLDISSWESGIYLARITTNNKNYIARIVKY